MRRTIIAVVAILMLSGVGFSGYLVGSTGEPAGQAGRSSIDEFNYVPGTQFVETGKTVHLKATVLDLINKTIYPQFNANMWAFCFKAADPNDAYSAAAIEYQPNAGVDVTNPDWKGTCSTPGPVLRFKQGDKIIVDFENNHVHPHTIHWHGQYLPASADGAPGSTQDSVRPGESYRYEYIATKAGTLWYHCHVDTQFHIMQGLYGVIVVEPQETQWEPSDIDEDRVLVLGTLKRSLVEATPERVRNPHAGHQNLGACGATGEPGCQNPAIDVTPDVWMMNGVSAPSTLEREDTLIKLKPGERLRLRILNAGTTAETLHPHGHDFLVTHTDGNPLSPAARYWVDTLLIGPAQRFDVVLEGQLGREGVWEFHTHVETHNTNDKQYPGGMATKIVYPGFEEQLEAFKAELPGGQPTPVPVTLPKDFFNRTRKSLDLSPDSHSGWNFPVIKPCAVKEFRFTAQVDSSNAVFQAANDVRINVTGPDNQTAKVLSLGNTRYQEWVVPQTRAMQELKVGYYRLVAEGRAADAIMELTITVDYFDDSTEHREAGSPCKGIADDPNFKLTPPVDDPH
jgi:manganese oxidase